MGDTSSVVGTAATVHPVMHAASGRIQAEIYYAEITASQTFENQSRNLLSSFKYKKESSNIGSVCLSVFEDGEEVRHAPV
ncbi:hypothetical protein CRYUN_Cryun33cG0070300 [Craigia yunnanensis]